MLSPIKHFGRFFSVSLLVVLFFTNHAISQSRENNNEINNSEDKLKIIDVHTHGFSKSAWQNSNVVGGVAMPNSNGNVTPYEDKNVITCLGVYNSIDLNSVETSLKSKKYGCIKIFLGYVAHYAYDEHYKGVYELAQKYDVPVVFHTGDVWNKSGKLKYAHPLTIDEVAVDYRKVNFVIAHCGNPWYKDAAEVAFKNKNVFLECSAILTDDIKDKDPQIVKTLMIEPIKWVFWYVEKPEKIMFGSDYPIVKNIKSYIEAYKEAIPKEHWNAVFYENAACVYKFNKKFTDFRQVNCDRFWEGIEK